MDNYKKETFSYQIQPTFDLQNENIIKLKIIKEFSIQQKQSVDFQNCSEQDINKNNTDFPSSQSSLSQMPISNNFQATQETFIQKPETKIIKNQECQIQKTIESSVKFNTKLIKKRKQNIFNMKKIENHAKLERNNLSNQNFQSNSIPLIIQENDKQYLCQNGSFKVGRTTIDNFINQNIMQESNYQNNDQRYFMRFQRRRRRKRNAFGILEDRLPVL